MEDSHHATEICGTNASTSAPIPDTDLVAGKITKLPKTFGTKITGMSNIKITAGKLNSHGSCICLRLNFSIL